MATSSPSFAARARLPSLAVTGAAVRLVALAVAFVVSIGASLVVTLTSLTTPVVVLPVVVPIALAVVLATAAQAHHRPEPWIHDRHTDLMVALTGCGLGVALPALLQHRFEDLQWFVRLDLIGLPILAAGLIALLFGARAVWRMRWALAMLATTTPLLAAAAVGGLPGLAAGVVALVVLTGVSVLRRRRLPGPGRLHLPDLGRSWVIAIAVAVAGPVVQLAGGLLDLPASASPTTAQVAAAAPVGWTLTQDRRVDPPKAYDDLGWRRAVLRGPALDPDQAGVRQAIVDRLRSPSRVRLASLPINALYALDGRRAPGGGDVHLANGVRGTLRAWQNDKTRLTFTFVDFMLRPAGGDPERVLVAVTDERRYDPLVFPQPAGSALDALGTGLSTLLRGTPDELFAGRVLPPKNATVALAIANRIVRRTVTG